MQVRSLILAQLMFELNLSGTSAISVLLVGRSSQYISSICTRISKVDGNGHILRAQNEISAYILTSSHR
jgi:inner membrane protein involved in colicin E2 resistance